MYSASEYSAKWIRSYKSGWWVVMFFLDRSIHGFDWSWNFQHGLKLYGSSTKNHRMFGVVLISGWNSLLSMTLNGLEYFPELISVFRSQLSMRRTVGRWLVAVSRQPRKVVSPPIPLYSPDALSYPSQHNISHTICSREGQEGLVQGPGSRPPKESKAGAITLEWAAN